MAVKIVRQANKIALLGAPTSAAALSAGHEGAPAALRNAGLIDRLSSAGYQVTDFGDDQPLVFKPDEESPRARNIRGVIAALETLSRDGERVASSSLRLGSARDCVSHERIAVAVTVRLVTLGGSFERAEASDLWRDPPLLLYSH